ncbi:D-alanine--D-alanine ligase [Ornithobacterium rhinotracheale]|uniref:D-alanine--D-alanine ligase n=1 Tax=Ornithobacterium rhinotracheale TaxID=28251 RepID=UPI00129CF2DB|nr:D-alanine--D-alanine ligase [Ornithobacterium rhinotracheale]MRI63466.1 D-alanine--D-alanine ligase [Ornithobacterium rhinotracheale]
MQNVAIVMGGYSGEYEVSLRSGQTIFDHIDTSKYKPTKVLIGTEGWFAQVGEERYPIDKADFSFTDEKGEKTNFDVVFNIIHGTPGEDGQMQAYWQLINLPYVGCGHYLSALTFSKKDCIAVLSKYGISSAESVYLVKGEKYDLDAIIEKIGLPCFVKPNQSGSSLGISKVKTKEDFEPALAKAFEQDNDVLIESFLDGTEVSVGVVQYKGKTIVSGITEIVSENEFFDYNAKYEGESQEITPARLSPEITQKVEEIAKKAYDSLRMKGMSRSEYIIVNGEPNFIEMNTLPGFSPASILPQQLTYSKIEIKDFITSEIESALAQK